ncbi:MAG TPA: heme o synthase [Myxococcaceae bacterium]|nr:heme o synthase [Myxococcaceae bacterium]
MRDLVSLTKPRLSTLVLATAAGGMYLAPGSVVPVRAILSVLAIAGAIGAANVFNCYIERDSDRFMARTRNRPLPAGRMEPGVALAFGLLLILIALPLLMLAGNPLTALLGFIAFTSYVFVYTPLKAHSSLGALLVGGIPGALPPLMGWTVVTGRLDAGGLALFALLFAWQMPHFLAIALFRQREYHAAGLTVTPLESGDTSSRWQLLAWSLVLLGVSVLPTTLGFAGVTYLVSAIVLGSVFVGFAVWGVVKRLGAPWARRTFAYSLVYLTAIFAVLMLDGGPRV